MEGAYLNRPSNRDDIRFYQEQIVQYTTLQLMANICQLLNVQFDPKTLRW